MANDDMTAEEREYERQLLSAMEDTDVEIFKYGVHGKDVEEDENDGDRSLEQMDDPVGVDDPATPESYHQEAQTDDEDGEDQQVEQTDGEQPDEGSPDEPQEPRPSYVPSVRLREESEARQRAEREAAEWRTRYDEMQRIARPPQPQQPPPPEPDLFADPEAWKQDFRTRVINETRQTMARASVEEARARYGEEFEYAYHLLDSDPRFAREAQAVLASLNPGEAIMRLAEPHMAEFRQQRQEQELAQAQQIAARNGYALVPGRPGGPSNSRPQPLRNNPPSLNGASGGGNARRERLDPRGMDGSEGAIFRDAFSDLRR